MQYFGGYFDKEEHAAMKINLMCDKYERERKNPTINMKSDDVVPRVSNQTSKYIGVAWDKKCKKWKTQLIYKGKSYYGGYFDIEEHAAMELNLICDKIKIKRKNPEINIDIIQKKTRSKVHQYAKENIVDEKVKVEEKYILDEFKNGCENRFTQSNDEEGCIVAKRKRKQNSMINDDVKEEKEENELLEKIQQDYTKIQD